MPNRLAQEKSLYLKQHAENPVDWWPWSDEAFAEAKKLNKPILLSIGYSACHWCHVMAHESFENEKIAQIMNDHFVCIKIDREERPEVDQVYMETVHMLHGQGGWPLNVFCLPDGKPFAGGTYFPPDDRGGRQIPWPDLLQRVSEHFNTNKEELEKNSEAILGNLSAMNQIGGENEENFDPQTLIKAAEKICADFDDKNGGFGGAPKFPPSMQLSFLLSIRGAKAISRSNKELAKRIDVVIQKTLDSMALGGLYDQIGGGFYRYSTDEKWLIPHFEKMLYDNALLIDIYSRAWKRYREPLYQKIVEESIEWLLREMKNDAGSFSASIDADNEDGEGDFYTWTPKEIEDCLGKEKAPLCCNLLDITSKGNFEKGRSNPIFKITNFNTRKQFDESKSLLLKERETRQRPTTDSKTLTSWNALIIRALSEAAFIFGRKDWFEEALQSAEFIWENLQEDGRLKRVFYDEAKLDGNLDDYAYTVEAFISIISFIDWIKPQDRNLWQKRSEQLLDFVIEHFSDPQKSGYFFTPDDGEALIHRKKEWFDQAIPAANSSLLHSFSCMYSLSKDAKWKMAFEELKKAYIPLIEKVPNGLGHALSGISNELLGIATLNCQNKPVDDLQKVLNSRPWRRVFVFEDKDENKEEGYQLCIGEQCLAPITKFERLRI